MRFVAFDVIILANSAKQSLCIAVGSSLLSVYKVVLLLQATFNRRTTYQVISPDHLGLNGLFFGSNKRHRWRHREREKKCGCWAGLLNRLRKHPHKTLFLSLFLANVRSIAHKMNELELRIATENSVPDCVMIMTKPGFILRFLELPCSYRDAPPTDRTGGETLVRAKEAVCAYTYIHNNDWWSQSWIIDSHCSPYLEALTVICHPFYCPRELTVVTAYIPPDASISIALTHLHSTISKQERAHPDKVYMIAGDFNQASLKSVPPNFTQYVKCATSEKIIIDHVYCNIKHAYSSATAICKPVWPSVTACHTSLHPCQEDIQAHHKTHQHLAWGCPLSHRNASCALPPAHGLRTSLPKDHNQWSLAPIFPPPSHSELAHLKAVCWVHSCTHCILKTVTLSHPSNTLIKFADTTVAGLMTDGDETDYREEIQQLAEWCSVNNLLLNTGCTTPHLSNSREFTSRMNLLGPWTARQWQRRFSSDYIFCEFSGKII